MLAIDTNVVVRYLTTDDPTQSRKARALIEGEDVFVCTTVLLETAWVLRSTYGFDAIRICKALRAFAGLERVSLEDSDLVAVALDRVEGGMDFADALHLGRAEGADAFLTFDRDLIKAARTTGLEKVRAP
jgi:predicted nucleic-acid-binding protein